MKREEHKAIINQLLTLCTPENQATASDLLTTLSDDYNLTLDEAESLTQRNNELTANNENLRDVNTRLFLKVGSTENKADNNQQTNEQETEIPDISFESLFNDKGELN